MRVPQNLTSHVSLNRCRMEDVGFLFSLHKNLEKQLQNLFEWHYSQQQRRHGKEACEDQMNERARIYRQTIHMFNKGIAIAKIGEGLNIAGSQQRLTIQRPVAYPLFWKAPV
jgi:hypothetical protein